MPLSKFNNSYGDLVQCLLKAKQHQRISHAYLLTGDQSDVLLDFLNAWLEVNVCQQNSFDGDSCGLCPACLSIENGSYQYLKTIKAQSKSRQIRLEQIYEMEHFLHLTSGGQLKLAIIYDADRMNIQTQNAFLKTLEEPSADTMIILMTQNPSMLLNTIRSRCQRISIFDNQFTYHLDQADRLFQTLSKMTHQSGALTASKSTEAIIEILSDIKSKVESESKENLKLLKADLRQMEAPARKQLEEEQEAFMASVYKGKRESILSAIHTWFSQDFMLSKGIQIDKLPNPDIYESIPGYVDEFKANSKDSIKRLEHAEKLLKTLAYNVDEKLAIEDFCQSICRKN